MQHITSTTQRIFSLDVLRGFALLGILVMNIQSFSMPSATYLNPTAFGDFTGVNFYLWLLGHVFFEQKFMTLFSMLFGVGVMVFSERLQAKSLSVAKYHYRRTFWLLFFGLIHGYVFWYGDILYTYAMCGFWVYLLRKKSATTLFILAFVFIAISSAISLLTGFAIPHMPAEVTNDIMQIWRPDAAAIQVEIAAYTGSWDEAIVYRAEETVFFQTYLLLTHLIWRAGGVMLLGMALYKWEFFSLQKQTQTYITLALLSAVVGFTLVLLGVDAILQHNFTLEYTMFIGSQFNYWGSIFVGIAYASLVMLWAKLGKLMSLQQRLSSLGQTAFSNYILQTLICTAWFYGLGFFATFDRFALLWVVLAVWLFQLLVTPIWLRYFRFGPLEWVWRCLTYWQRQPLKR